MIPKSRNDFPAYLDLLGLHGNGIEIGVRYGTFSAYVLKHWQCLRWCMVDAWKPLPDSIDATQTTQEECDDWYRRTIKAMRSWKTKTRILRMMSVEAVKWFVDETFDFIYLDAGHTYPSASEDLHIWWPKLRPGGVFAGHDFFNGHVENKRPVVATEVDPFDPPLFAVQLAVEQFAKGLGKPVHQTTDDIFNSWWIVK